MALPPQVVAAAKQRTADRDQLLQSAQQVVPQAVSNTAQNAIGLISQGLSGATNALTAGQRRNIQQQNLDRDNAIRLEGQEYLRGQATQERDDRLAAQKLDEAFRQAQFSFQKEKDARDFDAQQKYRASVLAGQAAGRAATERYRQAQLNQKVGANRQAIKDAAGNIIGTVDKSTGNFYDVGNNLVKDGFKGQGEIQTNEDGIVINAKTGLNADFNQDQIDAARGASTNYATATDTIRHIDTITPQDVENAAGTSSLGGAWTGDTRASVGKLNQLLGKEFLGNVSALKGMGSLSNAEGSKITAAANALVDPETNVLKTGLDEGFVAEQLGVIKNGYERMQNISKFVEQNGREPTIREFDLINAGEPAGVIPQGQPVQPTGGSAFDVPQTQQPVQQAPQAAIDYLRANPNSAGAFQQKYGYLPQ